jgi:hypothetical protein
VSVVHPEWRKFRMKTMTNAQRLAAIGTSLLAWVWLVIPCPSAAAQDKPPAAAASDVRALAIVNKPGTGDFDALVARRTIRVLVPYSPRSFSTTRGASAA